MFFQVALGQNKSEFFLENKSIKHVMFEAKQIAKIYAETGPNSTFMFESSAESTYKNELYFDYSITNDSLIITDIYPKHLEFGSNKMTSTQIFSVEVWLKIPKDLSLSIDSKYASIAVNGEFKNLFVNTKSGTCSLNIVNTDANVSTYSGDIMIKTADAAVDAESQNGKLNITAFELKRHRLKLKSVDGDIIVKSTN